MINHFLWVQKSEKLSRTKTWWVPEPNTDSQFTKHFEMGVYNLSSLTVFVLQNSCHYIPLWRTQVWAVSKVNSSFLVASAHKDVNYLDKYKFVWTCQITGQCNIHRCRSQGAMAPQNLYLLNKEFDFCHTNQASVASPGLSTFLCSRYRYRLGSYHVSQTL